MKKLLTSKIGFRITGGLFPVLLLITAVLAYRTDGLKTGDNYLFYAVLMVVLSGVIMLVRIPSRIYGRIRNLVLILVIPFLAVLLVQNYTLDPLGEKPIYTMMLVANCVFYYLFYLLLACMFGSFRVGYTIASIIMCLIGIANYFVIQFRGSPIVPWDLFSIRTAASVAGGYTYSITWRFFMSFGGFILVIAAGLKNNWKVPHWWIRLPGFVLCLGLFIFCTHKLQEKEVKDWLGMDQTLFTPNVRYRNNGFVAAFLGNLHLIEVEKPDGYSEKKVEALQSEVEAKHTASDETFDVSKAPNIIVIMDEAFSDLSVRGDFGISEDPIPNFRKMMEENVGGQLMVSVKGGNTANTEYEFLSGDTMAFLPAGSVVYQQFIHDNVPTLPSYLASLGYSTTAIHPYLATGWDRDTVYPQLGFQQFLSIDNFYNPNILREYVSDESAFDKIIEEFKRNKDSGSPQFIFEVTMQNHSGYSKDYPGFEPTIDLTDLSYKNTQQTAVEKYLTLTKYSDEALGHLMEYFNTVEEPTIIIMFGDHQPSDYITNVIDDLTGYDPESEDLEEAQKQYIVPYFIWNNFGMEIEDRDLTSVNYLAANTLQAAGIPLTSYQEFLLDLQKELPVVSGGAYVSTDGTYYSFDEKDTPYSSILNTYNILQYNHLTDFNNRDTSMFTTNAETNAK